METLEITQEMIEALKKPLPVEAISQHPTKPYLSSIKAVFVTERLSDVFGVGNWHIKSEVIEKGEKGMIVVKVTLSIPKYGVEHESFGGNDNGGESSKNFDLGDAYKGAVTDAITKIGSWMYIGIDVFKGQKKQAPNSEQSKQPINELPWLNQKTDLWTKAVLHLKNGGKIEDVEAKYKLSKDNKAALITESK